MFPKVAALFYIPMFVFVLAEDRHSLDEDGLVGR